MKFCDSDGNCGRAFVEGFDRDVDEYVRQLNSSDPGQIVHSRTLDKAMYDGLDYEEAMTKVLAEDENLKREYADVDENETAFFTDENGAGVSLDRQIHEYCLRHNLDFVMDYEQVMDKILSTDKALLRAYSEEGEK